MFVDFFLLIFFKMLVRIYLFVKMKYITKTASSQLTLFTLQLLYLVSHRIVKRV